MHDAAPEGREEYREIRFLGIFTYRHALRNGALPPARVLPCDPPLPAPPRRFARALRWTLEAIALGLIGVGLTWLLLR